MAASTPGVLPQESLDAVDAGRAGHALDRQGELDLGGRASGGVRMGVSSYSLGVYQPGTMAAMDRPVAWTATMPGPWSPIHVAVSSRTGVLAAAWLTVRLTRSERSLEARRQGRRLGHRATIRRPHAAPAATPSSGPSADVLAGRTPDAIPVDLARPPDWDRAGPCRGPRHPGWGETA